MKKYLLVLITLLLITGCGSKDEIIVSNDYISSKGGRFCGLYAITSILPENYEAYIITVYKNKEYGNYIKLFDTKENSFFGKITTNNENIYFVHMQMQTRSGLEINAYNLEDGTYFSDEIDANDIYHVYDLYGIKDNYLYLKYTKYKWAVDNGAVGEVRVESKEYSYAKISLDLKTFEEINESDIPAVFHYPSC